MKLLNGFYKKFKSIAIIFTFFKIDYSFLLMLIFALILKELKIFALYTLFIILHELCHFFVAKKLGYMAKCIKLSFFGASLEGLDDFSLSDELKVIFAGPVFNFVIVVFCYLSFWFNPESYNYLYEILVVNLAILIFNLLPVYPLDAGRIILTILTQKHTRRRALKITKIISFCFISFLFVIFLGSIFYEFNFMLGLVCVNLMNLLLSSTKNTSFKRELFVFHKAKLLKKGLIERNVILSNDKPLYTLFRYIDDYHFINFIFLNENFEIVDEFSEIDFYKKVGYM